MTMRLRIALAALLALAAPVGAESTFPLIPQTSVSVERFFTGGTYDAAFSAAIATVVAAGGGTVLLTSGKTYDTSAPIAINNSNIAIRCPGQGQCTIRNSSMTSDIVSVNVGTTVSTTITTNGTTSATVASATGLKVGMQVASAHVPGATTITAIAGTAITLSAAATATASGTAAVFGTYVSNVVLENLILTKSVTATAGCAVNIRNAGYLWIANNRIYGAGRLWAGLCGMSSEYAQIEKNTIDNVQNVTVALGGVSSKAGALEGMLQDWIFDRNQWIGGHAATASPLSHGSMELGDYVGGIFIRTQIAYNYRGYAINMAGTVAPGAGVNSLIFILDPNFEADFDTASGGIAMKNYMNVSVTGGWFGGKGAPAFNFDTGSKNAQITGSNIYRAGSAGPAVSCAGPLLAIGNASISGYVPGVGTGVGIARGCAMLNLSGGHILNMRSGIANNGASDTVVSVNGVQFFNNSQDVDPVVTGWAKFKGCGNANASGRLALGTC